MEGRTVAGSGKDLEERFERTDGVCSIAASRLNGTADRGSDMNTNRNTGPARASEAGLYPVEGELAGPFLFHG